MPSVPKASVLRITQTMSALGYKGPWATQKKLLLVPGGGLAPGLEGER